jgi:cephalosporin-C deacetylase
MQVPTLPHQPEPADFDAFWGTVATELANTEPAPEVELLPLRSSAEALVYGVRFTSIGPYRLFAYYVQPPRPAAGAGPRGVEVQLAGHGSVVHVPVGDLDHRWPEQRAVLTLCHRGQRLSDRPYAAAYPGLLTDGIESPEAYTYRGIVADACRAVDFLLSRPPEEVDHSAITVTGNDVALFVAALRGREVSSVRAAPSLFYRLADVLPTTDDYPLAEFNDYLRTYPERAADVARTLGYFDPLAAARRAACPVQVGDDGFLAPLRAALGANLAPPS